MSAYTTDEGHVFVVCCISCKKYTVSSCPLVPTYITFFHSVVPESRTKFRSPDTDDFSNDIWDGKFRMRFYILNKLPFVLVMAAAHWQPCRVPQFLGKKVLSFTIFFEIIHFITSSHMLVLDQTDCQSHPSFQTNCPTLNRSPV